MQAQKITIPNINSSDREERIAARRARIAHRIEQRKTLNSQNGALSAPSKEEEQPQPGTGEKARKQIKESKMKFKGVLENGIEEVTSVRVITEEKEKQRKQGVLNKNEEQKQRRATEKAQSEETNELIMSQWKQLLDCKVPETLVKAIEEQNKLCNQVLESKDGLIGEYQKEIKLKEEEYVKALTKQAEEIDELIKRMREQFKKLVEAYETELSTIEEAFLEERKALQASNAQALEALYEDRRRKEIQFMEWKQERSEEARKQIEELRIMESEEYNELKIKLETEIQTLEQQLQTMKATYQLNNEKLSHNFRLLQERDFDHTQLIQQQKKKINRLQDMLSTLKAKYAKADKKYRQKNLELTEEYKRITEQYKDLQSKFRHFQDRDHKKFREIWEMNEERVSVLVQRLLQADKVVSEQQLGLNWFPPTRELFELETDTDIEKQSNIGSSSGINGSIQHEFTFILVQQDMPVYDESMKDVVALICNEAGFLVEEKVKHLLATSDDPNRIKISSIMNALGIETAAQAEKLLSYFILPITNEDEEPQLISPTDALNALKAFVNDHQSKIKEASMEALTTTEEEKQEKKQKIKEREYWERLANCVSDKTVQIWGLLEKELLGYNEILNERSKLLSETDSIRRQNDELKLLLNQYLNSKINEELVIPPVTIV